MVIGKKNNNKLPKKKKEKKRLVDTKLLCERYTNNIFQVKRDTKHKKKAVIKVILKYHRAQTTQ